MPPHDLDPVTRLTADAIGEPGARTFLLQAASGLQQITLLVEKDQVRVLAERVIAWLPELAAENPEDDDLPEPTQEAREVRLWVTRAQLRVMARHGAQVVQQGRPPCPLCGNPLDPTGHVCPAQNGHRPTVV